MIELIGMAVIGTLMSLWRRWFGGGFGKYGEITRIYKYIALLLVVLLAHLFIWEFDIKQILYEFVLLAIYWAGGHGAWFIVNDKSTNGEGRNKLIDWMLFETFGENESRTFAGNCSGMLIRYTLYAIPVAIMTDGWFMCAGFAVAISYGLCGKLFPNKPYTQYAEFSSGFFIGMLYYLCIYIN